MILQCFLYVSLGGMILQCFLYVSLGGMNFQSDDIQGMQRQMQSELMSNPQVSSRTISTVYNYLCSTEKVLSYPL